MTLIQFKMPKHLTDQIPHKMHWYCNIFKTRIIKIMTVKFTGAILLWLLFTFVVFVKKKTY